MARHLNQRLSFLGTLAVAGMMVTGFSSGCSTSMFTSHPDRMNPILTEVKKGDKVVLEKLKKPAEGQDKALYLMERGRLQEFLGEPLPAQADYDGVLAMLKDEDSAKTTGQKAGEAAGSAGSEVAAVLVNDNAIPYAVPGYEQMFLVQFRGMEYLMEGKLEDARVESKRAIEDIQKAAQERQEKEMAELKAEADKKAAEDKEAGKKGLGTEAVLAKELANPLKEMEAMAGTAKNLTNGYAYFLDGLLREMKSVQADPDGARISYVQAAQSYPTNKYLRQSIARLAKGDESGVSELALKPEERVEVGAGQGEVVVLFEDGFVPQKQEIKVPVPLPTLKVDDIAGIAFIAFPIYKGEKPAPQPLTVKLGGSEIGKTEVICDVGSLAVRELKDRVPALVIRQTLRFAAKAAATMAVAEATKDQDPWVAIGSRVVMSGANYLSENADLRSWVTLPAYAQVLRAPLAAGAQKIELAIDGTSLNKTVDVPVEAGKITVVRVFGLGTDTTLMPVQVSKPM